MASAEEKKNSKKEDEVERQYFCACGEIISYGPLFMVCGKVALTQYVVEEDPSQSDPQVKLTIRLINLTRNSTYKLSVHQYGCITQGEEGAGSEFKELTILENVPDTTCIKDIDLVVKDTGIDLTGRQYFGRSLLVKVKHSDDDDWDLVALGSLPFSAIAP